VNARVSGSPAKDGGQQGIDALLAEKRLGRPACSLAAEYFPCESFSEPYNAQFTLESVGRLDKAAF
jgi:hypothetical protein